MPLLTTIPRPDIYGGVVEDPNPARNRVYINNLAYNKDTLEIIADPDMGIPSFFFQSGTSDGANGGPTMSDTPVVITTNKYGGTWSDARQSWYGRIGSWDPWLLFLDYNNVNINGTSGRTFYNPLTKRSVVYWPRDLTGSNMRQDSWVGDDLEYGTSNYTQYQNDFIIPVILREDNQWLALDQNYYGSSIVWQQFNAGAPTIAQTITYNDNIQHFVLGEDDLGRSWFLEVHGGTHAYTVQMVGMNSMSGVRIVSQMSNITGGYSNIINQFPSNFIPNNSKRKVFYSSHYNASGILSPYRFVWSQDVGTIEHSLCTITYPNVGDTYGTYAAVCTDSTTNYNAYGNNAWYMKPHTFTKAGKYYIVFCTIEKSQPYFRAERWSQTKQRAWVTYEINSTNDNNLIYHSSITWPSVDDMPRGFLPMNSDGDKMLVFQTNRLQEIVFNVTSGWVVRKTTGLDVRAYGIDSTDRIYLITRSGSQPATSSTTADTNMKNGYNSIYTYDSNLPNNVEITFTNPSGYTYSGTTISTNCIVNTNNQQPVTIRDQAQISDWSPFNGYWSHFFPSTTGTGALTYLPVTTNLNLDSTFTIECYMYKFTNNTQMTFFGSDWKNGSGGIDHRVAFDQAGVSGRIGLYNGTSWATLDTGTSPVNTWFHIALVRSGTTVTVYIDGTSRGTISTSTTYQFSGGAIGGLRGSNETVAGGMYGYINNFRVVKGIAVYTGTFTRPSLTLTATQSAGTNISAITGTETSLIACHERYFRDNSSYNLAITAYGTVSSEQVSPITTPNIKNWSIRTSWTTGTAGRIGFSGGPHFDFDTGDFCVEFWMFNNYTFSTQTDGCGIVGHKTNDSFSGWQIFRNGDSKLCLRLGAGVIGGTLINFDFKTASNVPQDNKWHHWALVRQSNGLKWYLDGVLDTSTSSTHDIKDHHAQLWVGYDERSGAYWSGWMSNLRITKGNCVYTAPFVPPTSPLTAIQNAGTNINAITAGQCTLLAFNTSDIRDSGNLVDTTLRLKINGSSATFSDGSVNKVVTTVGGTVSVPILITGSDYTSIDAYSITPLTWITAAGSLTAAAKSENYSYQIQADGTDLLTPTYAISSGSLPPGLTLNSTTGLISGIPTNSSAQTYTFIITVSNATDSIQRNFSIYSSLERPVVSSLGYPNAANNIFVANVLGGETLTVYGTNFRTNAQVRINNDPLVTTYINSTTLTCTTQALASNTYNLTVYNDDNVISQNFSVIFSSIPSFTTSTTLTPILENINAEISINYSTDSSVTWTVVSSNLPGTLSFDIVNGKIVGNPGTILTSTASYNITLKITDTEGQSAQSTFTLSVYKAGTTGQIAYTIPGTYTWICPSNVTTVHALCIGAGGSGANGVGGGGGGGTAYKNNISVTPGNSYTVVVGAAGTAGSGGIAGNSYFINTTTVAGGGGAGATGGRSGGGYVGDGGGNGGNGGLGAGAGGGGAGGYNGTGGFGGAGDYVSNTLTQSGGNGSGGGGGGGGGAYNSYNSESGRNAGGGGGGVGLFGQGNSGTGAVMIYETVWGGVGKGGSGGSGGTKGGDGSGNFYYLDPDPGGTGGNYGGGGGAPSSSTVSTPANGAVRLIWGPNRLWPSTNTADQ